MSDGRTTTLPTWDCQRRRGLAAWSLTLVVHVAAAGCTPSLSRPDHVVAPQLAPERLGQSAPVDRCAVDGTTESILMQGSGALMVRRTAEGPVERLQPQRGEVVLLRGSLLLLDGTSLRELEGDGAVPLPGAEILRVPFAVAVHPDGRELAVWSRSAAGPVLVVDGRTGALVRMLAEHGAPVTAVGFGARGRVITADRTGWVRVWGATGARPEAWLRPFDDGGPSALAASGDVVAACRGSQVWLWGVAPHPDGTGVGLRGRIELDGPCAALSMRDGLLAVAFGSGSVLLWDVEAAEARGIVRDDHAVDVCVAGPHAVLVVGDDGQSAARLWDSGLWARSAVQRWTPPAPDPVARLTSETFVALYQRARCEQQRGDARALVHLLLAHGVPDLPTWTQGSRRRLEDDPALLERVANGGAPCP